MTTSAPEKAAPYPHVAKASLGAPSVAGLFAGIGGMELGLRRAGWNTRLLCDNDPAAIRVLQNRFLDAGRETAFVADVSDVSVEDIRGIDLIAAGFPCQDLSQAGLTQGIGANRSSLVGKIIQLIREAKEAGPEWLLLENVPFMLRLDRGRAMTYLTSELSDLGFTWAYRVVDQRAFGVPQRRQRVLLLASRSNDPRPVLFTESEPSSEPVVRDDSVFGFYWTEGLRGLGWAVDAVPTLKGGSGLGIPSPPAIWFPEIEDLPLRLPDIRDVERLQGFDADWTLPADVPTERRTARWRLVGNAIPVEMTAWLGQQLLQGGVPLAAPKSSEIIGTRWPIAAWGDKSGSYEVKVSMWPQNDPLKPLRSFLRYPTTPLSLRAASGFLSRLRSPKRRLRIQDAFLDAVETHVAALSP